MGEVRRYCPHRHKYHGTRCNSQDYALAHPAGRGTGVYRHCAICLCEDTILAGSQQVQTEAVALFRYNP